MGGGGSVVLHSRLTPADLSPGSASSAPDSPIRESEQTRLARSGSDEGNRLKHIRYRPTEEEEDEEEGTDGRSELLLSHGFSPLVFLVPLRGGGCEVGLLFLTLCVIPPGRVQSIRLFNGGDGVSRPF